MTMRTQRAIAEKTRTMHPHKQKGAHQVWQSSRESLLNGRFSTGSTESVPLAYPCPHAGL